MIADSAAPSVDVSNELEVFFTVTENIDADLSILWAGALEVGEPDRVILLFQEVDSTGDSEGSVISLYSESRAQNNNGGNGNDFTIPVSLEAGQGYRIYASGVAESGSPQSSQIAFTLVVPEPGSLALLGLGGLMLLRRRR